MKLSRLKQIDLYWFSGSGNTLYIARHLAGFLEEKGFIIKLIPIESTNPQNMNLDHTVGLCVPVAEQGTYPLVWNFIKNMPSPSDHNIFDTDVFFLDTLMLYSGGIKGPVKKILNRKGYRLLGAIEIIMPNNLMKLKKQPEKDKLKMQKGRVKVEVFAEKLIAGTAEWKDIPLYSDMMGSFSKKDSTWNMFRKYFPLKVDNAKCTRCRLCERICPEKSWRFDKEKNEMNWLKTDCIYCLRCFSYCPAEAITYGKKKYIRHKPLTAGVFSASKYS